MKKLSLLILLFPLVCSAQFGFERTMDINVIKNNIQQKYPWVGGLDYCQFSNVDLNQDGTLDLFIFDRTCDKVITFIQDGTPGVSDFKYAPKYENYFESLWPTIYSWVLFKDYDGDGKMDLFTVAPSSIGVFKNISTINNGLDFTYVASLLSTTFDGNSQIVYNSKGDIPAIEDIDGDGDLDVLSFYVSGRCLRYYRNLSKETYGHSDSLIFRTASTCFGNFMEGLTNNSVVLDTCCKPQVNNPEGGGRRVLESQDRHSGSTVLALDLDGDNMKDLLIGDASYNNLIMLMNGGTLPNTNSAMMSYDSKFPSYDTTVDLSIFPAGFYVDVTNDGIRDLVVTPNSTLESHNFQSCWLYNNNGADNFPVFKFQGRDFLQSDMIEYGSRSIPIYFDHNGDSLLDLIVAATERYDYNTGNTISIVSYYENTGTKTKAEYTFITNDYQNLSTLPGVDKSYLIPAFGDLDNDGDQDMIVPGFSNSIFMYENLAGPGKEAKFDVNFSFLIDKEFETIYFPDNYVPKLVDLNRDGLMDLVMGKENGKLAYFENQGTLDSAKFELVNDNLGGVDVSEYWSPVGDAVPEFIDIDSSYKLILGSSSGYLHYYDSIDNNLDGNFKLIDSTLDNIYIGTYSAPAAADLDGDNKLEMIVGNKRGGVVLFESAHVSTVGVNDSRLDIELYPNPTTNSFIIDLTKSGVSTLQSSNYELFDISGRQVVNQQISRHKTEVDCSNYSKGIYLLMININGRTIKEKIVIQ